MSVSLTSAKIHNSKWGLAAREMDGCALLIAFKQLIRLLLFILIIRLVRNNNNIPLAEKIEHKLLKSILLMVTAQL